MHEETCRWCNKKFETEYWERYCSKKCDIKDSLLDYWMEAWRVVAFLVAVASALGIIIGTMHYLLGDPVNDQDCTVDNLSSGEVVCEKVCGTRTVWIWFEKGYCHWDDMHGAKG